MYAVHIPPKNLWVQWWGGRGSFKLTCLKEDRLKIRSAREAGEYADELYDGIVVNLDAEAKLDQAEPVNVELTTQLIGLEARHAALWDEMLELEAKLEKSEQINADLSEKLSEKLVGLKANRAAWLDEMIVLTLTDGNYQTMWSDSDLAGIPVDYVERMVELSKTVDSGVERPSIPKAPKGVEYVTFEGVSHTEFPMGVRVRVPHSSYVGEIVGRADGTYQYIVLLDTPKVTCDGVVKAVVTTLHIEDEILD